MSSQKDYLEAKRQEVLAKMARIQNQNPSLARISQQQQQQQQQQRPAPSHPTPGAPVPAGGVSRSEIQRKIDEVKQRLLDQKKPSPMPSLPTSSSGKIDLRAMLDKGIIPKRDQQLKASRKPSAPAAAAKKVEATPVAKKENPYLSKEALPYHGRSRKTRPMRFVEPGKFVEKAEQQRSKAQLERLKEQVAAKVQQAGMQVDLDISDKALKREQPPVVEWWDAPLLPHQSYDDLPIDPTQLTSLVTSYVHHPVQITPPNENTKPVTRALRLTKTETKKLRRQRRREMLKDKQDKIRLGLLPPDPPKVKISNLMRVLGDEAILDPTKVEAKVRKEMEMRQRMHDEANAARKLTPDERRNKTVAKQKEDQDAGIEAAVFKIKNCSHPKLKFKIEKNANQYGLTGVVIANPKCNMVVVEGGQKAIKAYKKLMLRRIDWNDLPAARNTNHMDQHMLQTVAKVAEEKNNRCWLVWTGQVRQKHFKYFSWYTFESERMARQELTKWQAENYWDAAVMSNENDLNARQPELS